MWLRNFCDSCLCSGGLPRSLIISLQSLPAALFTLLCLAVMHGSTFRWSRDLSSVAWSANTQQYGFPATCVNRLPSQGLSYPFILILVWVVFKMRFYRRVKWTIARCKIHEFAGALLSKLIGWPFLLCSLAKEQRPYSRIHTYTASHQTGTICTEVMNIFIPLPS